MSVKDEVLGYFLKKINIPGSDEMEKFNCNYIDAKLLTSLEIVEMIVHFEELYNIHFSNVDLESDSFQTIGGLVNLIERARGK